MAVVAPGLTLQGAASWNRNEQTNSPSLMDANPASVNFGKPITESCKVVAGATVCSPLNNLFGPIGSPSANRGRREIEGLIGFFVNTLALRVDLEGDPTVSELIARARGVALGAQDNQDLPFEQVVEIVKPPRRLEHSPLFQVDFVWQSNEHVPFDLKGLKISPAPMARDRVRFDLELNLGEWGDRIIDDSLHGSPVIRRLVRRSCQRATLHLRVARRV